MNLTILSRNRNLHSIKRLLKEAKAQRIVCHVVDPLECQLVVGLENRSAIFVNDRPLPPTDVVLPRIGASITDYGLAVVKQFEVMGIKVINNSNSIAFSRDKFRCLQFLANKGIAMPTTVLMRQSRNMKGTLRYVRGTPVVIKVLQGTQGVGVMLAEGASSAESIVETMWNVGQDVLIQQYISESSGRDIRAFVIGDKVVAAMRRQAKEGEFRSNIHRGGEGVPVELKESYKRVAVQAAKAVGLSLAGVDLLESLSGPKVVEVNSSPGFEGIERATGLNIAGLIVKHAVQINRGHRAKKSRK